MVSNVAAILIFSPQGDGRVQVRVMVGGVKKVATSVEFQPDHFELQFQTS